jgi:hypothetical protein
MIANKKFLGSTEGSMSLNTKQYYSKIYLGNDAENCQ